MMNLDIRTNREMNWGLSRLLERTMDIKLNTGQNVREANASYIAQIESSLAKFSDAITSLHVHLAKDDSAGNGLNTNKCTLEAHLEARRPIAVTNHADSYDGAIRGALDKLTASLNDMG